MYFNFFHLMPYTDFPEQPTEWPVANKLFDPARGKQFYDDYLDIMAFADQCNFGGVGCNEHHFSPYGLMANCNLIGAALVNRTKKARLAMFGNLVPLLNPVRVAEEYAMLDCMSGGRLIAGLLRGVPHEYVAYNIPPGESRARLKEAVQLIVKCWTEPEPFGWEGEFYQFPAISIWPKPYQKPHPPILLSASNEESAALAGELGTRIGIIISNIDNAKRSLDVYKREMAARGREVTPDHVMAHQFGFIAESDEEAEQILKSGQEYFGRVLMRPLREAQRMVIQQTRYFNDPKSVQGLASRPTGGAIAERSIKDAVEAGSVLCGSPASVVKQVKRLHQALGHGSTTLTLKVGNIPDAQVRRAMELFRDRVEPEIRAL
jgi:alkanesulfonate monooxygenase SsuD/methylene tetrahydromethanopterin reductase-like flavin-dependent oxidoreductase (luciferase family)